jgi:threonine dehydratase
MQGPSPQALSDARARIADRIHCTPVERSSLIGAMVGVRLYFKCENLQKTGSFKVRGVLNKMATFDRDAPPAGVVTISAGNHAQALAWAAREMGVPCLVVMPANASPIKAEATRGYGAQVVLHGTAAEAFEHAHELERERGLTFVHPFDDLEIITGHASLGLELREQLESVTTVVVPVGGGGLISGVAAGLHSARPSIRIYGVEPEGAAAMRRSLEVGHAVHLDRVKTIAGGLAAPMAGNLNFEFVRSFVEDVVTVGDEEILEAMRLILTRAKLVVEPAGAAGLAAVLAGRIPLEPGQDVVVILSGGNVGLRELSDLGLMTDQT